MMSHLQPLNTRNRTVPQPPAPQPAPEPEAEDPEDPTQDPSSESDEDTPDDDDKDEERSPNAPGQLEMTRGDDVTTQSEDSRPNRGGPGSKVDELEEAPIMERVEDEEPEASTDREEKDDAADAPRRSARTSTAPTLLQPMWQGQSYPALSFLTEFVAATMTAADPDTMTLKQALKNPTWTNSSKRWRRKSMTMSDVNIGN